MTPTVVVSAYAKGQSHIKSNFIELIQAKQEINALKLNPQTQNLPTVYIPNMSAYFLFIPTLILCIIPIIQTD